MQLNHIIAFAKKSRLSLTMLLLFVMSSILITAQDTPTLVPFSDDGYQIQGVRPDGWNEVGRGLYARGSGLGDIALVAMQSAAVDAEALWESLLPQFGLETVPPAVTDYTSQNLNWTLYQFDVTVRGVDVRFDLAISEGDRLTYLILLQSKPEDYETLHNAVFVPALDAFAPLIAVDVPYLEEDVTFTNGDVTLAGTLTLPETEGQHPAIVLMTGSGQQDRDSAVVPGFPLFRLIADHLTRQGIAVLRYDDRGTGQSTGEFSEASIQDFASDGQAAVNYLKSRPDINPDQVGILGHSEGGAYSAMLGADPDSGIAFIVALAAPAVDLTEVLFLQNQLILLSQGASDELVESQIVFLEAAIPLIKARDWEALEQLTNITFIEQWALLSAEQQAQFGVETAEEYAQTNLDNFLQVYQAEWFVTFLDYDPSVDWAQTTTPILAIYGGLDIQVPPSQSSPALEIALSSAGNTDFEIVTLPTANHLFQNAQTGSLDEYAQLPGEFVPELLPTISDWIVARVNIAVN